MSSKNAAFFPLAMAMYLALMPFAAIAQDEAKPTDQPLAVEATLAVEPAETEAGDSAITVTVAPTSITVEALIGKWDLDLAATGQFVNLGFIEGIQTLGPRTWWFLPDNILRAGAGDPQGPAGFWDVENGRILVREPGETELTELVAELRGDVLSVQMPGEASGRKLIFKRDKNFGRTGGKGQSEDEQDAADSAFDAALAGSQQLPPPGLIDGLLGTIMGTLNNLPLTEQPLGLGAGDLIQGVTTLLMPDGTLATLGDTVAGVGSTIGTLADLGGTTGAINDTLSNLTAPSGLLGNVNVVNTVTGTVDSTVNTVDNTVPSLPLPLPLP